MTSRLPISGLLKGCKVHKTHRFERGGTNQIRKMGKREVFVLQLLPQTLLLMAEPQDYRDSAIELVWAFDCLTSGLTWFFYFAQCLNSMILESQFPHKTVRLLF